jgi:anti-anti-sigma regulatory factor
VLHAHRVGADDGVTLVLHGDLIPEAVPQLQSVLDALVLFQPDRLVVDLSEVGRVGSSALRMIDRCGVEIGEVVLRNPSPSARSDLENLGRSDLIAQSSTDCLEPRATPVHASSESGIGMHAFPETMPVLEESVTGARFLGA